MVPTRQYSGNGGFTLLELLVALVLVNLIGLVAFTALNLSLKAARQSQAAALTAQELRVGMTFLERSLSSTAWGPKNSGFWSYFVGEPQEMRFLTPLPLEAHNLGGLYHWRVLVGTDKSGQGCLVVEQRKLINWRVDPERVEERVILIKNLASLRFTYGLGSEYYTTWNGRRQGRLPDRVQIQMGLAGQETLKWLIPIHVSETARTRE
jgi:prepilin-type N-terminal cleavage/methylation domain-containing protein